MITIVGNAQPTQVEYRDFYANQDELATGDETDPEPQSSTDKRFSYDKVIKRKNRILLTDKTSRPTQPGGGGIGTHRPGHGLEKIPEHALKKIK